MTCMNGKLPAAIEGDPGGLQGSSPLRTCTYNSQQICVSSRLLTSTVVLVYYFVADALWLIVNTALQTSYKTFEIYSLLLLHSGCWLLFVARVSCFSLLVLGSLFSCIVGFLVFMAYRLVCFLFFSATLNAEEETRPHE